MITSNINDNAEREQEFLVNNGRRYQISIPTYFREQGFVVYEASVYDSAFNRWHTLYFRFRALKRLHEQMLKHTDSDQLPEFPKTRSFALWNRTNEHPRLIQDRIRDLEYYLGKLLNNGHLNALQEVAYIRRSLRNNQPRRSSSLRQAHPAPLAPAHARHSECPDLHKRLSYAADLL